jgi:hypothetical protein
MDWHELEKMKIIELRELAHEKTTLEGVSGLNKEHLVDALAKALGIPKPHKVVMGLEKTNLKKQIRALKAKVALASGTDKAGERSALRRQVHGLRRKLHRQAKLAG